MKERDFQAKLIKKLKKIFPDCIITKNDSGYIQGIPDLFIFHNDKWAALECKNTENAKKQPNQKYYIDKMNDMSYAAFVYPENEEEILNDLQQTFRT